MTEPGYTIAPARYAKGKVAVHCEVGDWVKTRAMRLAEAIANRRYTNRENAYIMSPAAAAKFVRLYADGYTADVFDLSIYLPDLAA